MPRYSVDFKEKIVQKMMPSNSQSAAQISRETGISGPTLYTWKTQYQREGITVPADPLGYSTHQTVLPKKTQFNHITDQQVQLVMEKLNNHPRKCLGMKTPNQVFFKDHSFVALRS